MKSFFFLLLGCALLSTEAATAAHRPHGSSKRAFAHANETEGRNSHMRFRHNPPPLPMLDLKAHNPEKFKTVRAAKNYKFK